MGSKLDKYYMEKALLEIKQQFNIQVDYHLKNLWVI